MVAQIQGHKPSATVEKHYKVRPLELLRAHHEKIEAWILEQAGIVFDAMTGAEGLRVVAAELKTVTLHDTVQHDQDMPAQRPESLF